MIKNEPNVEENESILEEFVHAIFPIDFRMMMVQTMQKHDLIQWKDRPYNDIYLSNPLKKCFEFKKVNPASADILVDYFLTMKRSRTLCEILLNCMDHFLEDKFEHR